MSSYFNVDDMASDLPGQLRVETMGGIGAVNSFGPSTVRRLKLSFCQRQQLLTLQNELRKMNWAVMTKMHDELAILRDAIWPSEVSDCAGVEASRQRMSELRQQMFQNSLAAALRIDTLLTPDQRAQLRRSVH